MAYYANAVPEAFAAMPTRNVVITDHQAELIEELVSSGEYQNASEVLRDGLRLVAERRAAHKAKLKAIREAGRTGILPVEAWDREHLVSELSNRQYPDADAKVVRRSARRAPAK